MATPLIYIRLWIGAFCGLIFLLEIMAPPAYVFGHLYIIPILLAACELTSNAAPTAKILSATSLVTKICIFLTSFDFIVSTAVNYQDNFDLRELSAAVFINRINVVIVLLVTNWLIQSSLKYMEKIYFQKKEIDRHRAELLAQVQIDRIHRDFVYTLTHDLKTPLLGAIQTIKYFQKEKFGPVSSTQVRVLDKMSRSQHTSLELVKMLLDVYRNDVEGLILQRQPIDLRSIAKEAIDIMVILGWERQITINFNCNRAATKRPQLTGDRLQLSRVFSNLLSNAVYHSPRGSQIDVTIDDLDPQYIIVKVFDRGLAISSVDLPFLFDRFYQAHQQVQGSGLGLYLSRQIVDAHQGEIWAETGLPQGNKFCFSLPIGI
jgi:two-component system, NarL family, sensor kinase